jgi:hypothetical protein
MRNAGAGLDGKYQQTQAHIVLRAGQEPLERGNGSFGLHVEGDIKGSAQGTGDHQAAKADDVEGPKLHLMQGAAPGVPEA